MRLKVETDDGNWASGEVPDGSHVLIIHPLLGEIRVTLTGEGLRINTAKFLAVLPISSNHVDIRRSQ